MKLTIAEQEFIHDAKVYLERGETSILIDSKLNIRMLAKACEEHLGSNVWFYVTNKPNVPIRCWLETDFRKRYASNILHDEFTVFTPKPFEIIHGTELLQVSEDEQLAIHNENVRRFKEPVYSLWRKIKQHFA